VPPRRDLPTAFLRLEGLVLLGLALLLYAVADGSWIVFLLLFLVPDVAILAYLRGNTVGALIYNLCHTYLVPALLVVLGIVAGGDVPVLLGLIWFAHIGMDRMLGFGLKFPTGFGDTHLGTVGRARGSTPGTGGRRGTVARPRRPGADRSQPPPGPGTTR
jgi:Domain of unknown function (DUF4260)